MGIEDEQAFESALLDKLGAGTEPETPGEETPADAAPPPEQGDTGDQRPRNELGQFVTQQDEAAKPLAGKFKSPEDLERAYLEAEQFIGRQSAEVAEARRLMQELQAQQSKPDLGWLSELVDDDPYTAAEMAREAGDQAAYTRVMQSWSEDNPEAARLYHQNVELAARQQAMEQQLQQALQPVQQQLQDQRLAVGWRNVATRHPDVQQMGDELAAAAAEAPELAYALQSPGQEERALEQLYYIAKAKQGFLGQQAPQAPQVPQQNPAVAGYVAQATASQPVQPQAPDDFADAFKQAFNDLAGQQISVSRGITRDQ